MSETTSQKGTLHHDRLSYDFRGMKPVRVTILRQYKSSGGDRYELRIEDAFSLGKNNYQVGDIFGVPVYAVEPDAPEAIDHTGQTKIDRIASALLDDVDI